MECGTFELILGISMKFDVYVLSSPHHIQKPTVFKLGISICDF